MSLKLTPELDALVREKVASGDYRDESNVLVSALQLLDEHDKAKLDALLAALDEGDADLAAGRFVEVTTQEGLDALFKR